MLNTKEKYSRLDYPVVRIKQINSPKICSGRGYAHLTVNNLWKCLFGMIGGCAKDSSIICTTPANNVSQCDIVRSSDLDDYILKYWTKIVLPLSYRLIVSTWSMYNNRLRTLFVCEESSGWKIWHLRACTRWERHDTFIVMITMCRVMSQLRSETGVSLQIH